MTTEMNACVFLVLDNDGNRLGLPVGSETNIDVAALRARLYAAIAETPPQIVGVMTEAEARMMIIVHTKALEAARQEWAAADQASQQKGYH